MGEDGSSLLSSGASQPMAWANTAHCRDPARSSQAGNCMDKRRLMASSHTGALPGITQNPVCPATEPIHGSPVSLRMRAPAQVELPHLLTQSSIPSSPAMCSSHQAVPGVALRLSCATPNPGKPWTTLQETWPHLPLAHPASHWLHPPQQPRCPAKGNDQRGLNPTQNPLCPQPTHPWQGAGWWDGQGCVSSALGLQMLWLCSADCIRGNSSERPFWAWREGSPQ